MSGKDRIAIFPSRANSVAMKARILSANKGLGLLKRKRDALELKLREIVALRAEISQNFNELFSDAIFSIAKANFLKTDFKPALVIGSERADAFMRLTYTKTIGLLLPTFEPVIRKPESVPLTGLSRGGRQVELIRDKYQELLRTIILIASYDYSIRTLQDSIRSNNMRLNGLEYVVIPRFVNTAAYIRDELDEMEREEFYRLKRSQRKQHELREKGKAKAKGLDKKPDDETLGSADAGTWTGDDPLTEEEEEEEQMVLLPLSIFMKKKFASAAQTIISGHFPGSYELISPTDSVISGEPPIVSKRSKFIPVKTVDVKVTASSVSTKASEPTTSTKAQQEMSPTAAPETAQIDEPVTLAPGKSTIAAPKSETETARMSASSQKRVLLADDDTTTNFQSNVPAQPSNITSQTSNSISQPSNVPSQPSNVPSQPSANQTSGVPSALASTAASDATNKPTASSIKPSDSSLPTVAPMSTVSSGDKISIVSDSYPDTSVGTASALIDIKKLGEPSATRVPAERTEMSAQTDITGRYPRRSEMNSPPTNWAEDTYAARSEGNVPGRHGRASNTEHGNTSESDDTESNQ